MSDLVLTDVTVLHGRQLAVHRVSGMFAAGSLTAVVGPNGAGKTTLLRAIAGLHPIAGGQVDGAAKVAMLPQNAFLDRTFPLSCLEVVALGAARQAGPFRRIDPMAATAALAAVGLAGFERRQIGALSAGQFQRVLFARLMVQDAPVMLLDEPFNAVDARTQGDLLAVLKRWHRDGRTIVAVLHDLDLVRAAFPHTLLLARQVVGWGRTADVLRPDALMRARLSAEGWAEIASGDQSGGSRSAA